MESEITTRSMRAEDYDDVVRLWRTAEGVEIAEGDDRRTITSYLTRNPELSRVAERDGEIVAAVLCGHDGRRGLIYHLAVATALRGRGLGKRLVAECVAGLRAAGVPRVFVMVLRENERGKDFWAGQGFEEIAGATAMGLTL